MSSSSEREREERSDRRRNSSCEKVNELFGLVSRVRSGEPPSLASRSALVDKEERRRPNQRRNRKVATFFFFIHLGIE